MTDLDRSGGAGFSSERGVLPLRSMVALNAGMETGVSEYGGGYDYEPIVPHSIHHCPSSRNLASGSESGRASLPHQRSDFAPPAHSRLLTISTTAHGAMWSRYRAV